MIRKYLYCWPFKSYEPVASSLWCSFKLWRQNFNQGHFTRLMRDIRGRNYFLIKGKMWLIKYEVIRTTAHFIILFSRHRYFNDPEIKKDFLNTTLVFILFQMRMENIKRREIFWDSLDQQDRNTRSKTFMRTCTILHSCMSTNTK